MNFTSKDLSLLDLTSGLQALTAKNDFRRRFSALQSAPEVPQASKLAGFHTSEVAWVGIACGQVLPPPAPRRLGITNKCGGKGQKAPLTIRDGVNGVGAQVIMPSVY